MKSGRGSGSISFTGRGPAHFAGDLPRFESSKSRSQRVGAIVQARVGSSRFPRKVFADIAGHPLLWHVIRRLQSCKRLDTIIVATSDSPDDREILALAEEMGVSSFSGDEWDVQARFLGATRRFHLDIIVRICGDSPFIDPEMIDRLVDELLAGDADYAEPDPAIPAVYEGMEALTRAALERARELGDSEADREHVTLYIRRHPDEFRLAHLRPDPALRGSYRLSVDNQADLAFARAVYQALYDPERPFDARRLAAYLREHPQVLSLNAHVRQKDTAAKDLHLALGVCAPEELGGIIELARRFNEDWHCGIGVFGFLDPDEIPRIEAMGYRARAISPTTPLPELEKVLKTWKTQVVLLPRRKNPWEAGLRRRGWTIRFLDEDPESAMRDRLQGHGKVSGKWL